MTRYDCYRPLSPLFVVAVTTGMRQGELLALRWREPHGASRCATRWFGWTVAGGWAIRRPPVASAPIDLTAPTLDLLRTHRARTAERMLAVGHALTDDDLVEPLPSLRTARERLEPLVQ